MEISVELIHQFDESVGNRIVAFSQTVPEFGESYAFEEYRKRLEGKVCLIQFAQVKGKDAGFKIGYELKPGLFYSWMGGVHPEFRKIGVAKSLAQSQEQWVKTKGYGYIRMKTRNYLKNMLHFALSNAFYITGIEPHTDPLNNRILLEKKML